MQDYEYGVGVATRSITFSGTGDTIAEGNVYLLRWDSEGGEWDICDVWGDERGWMMGIFSERFKILSQERS